MNRWRVVLVGPGVREPASVWVTAHPAGDLAGAPGALVFVLDHDYLDMHPQPGWGAKRRGQVYEVLEVEGRSLVVREVS